MARVPKICKGCGQRGNLKEIFYGMPPHDYDREKYVIGGCSSEDGIAECTKCGWVKRKKQKETPWGLNDQISG
jgi:hypothetical protein